MCLIMFKRMKFSLLSVNEKRKTKKKGRKCINRNNEQNNDTMGKEKTETRGMNQIFRCNFRSVNRTDFAFESTDKKNSTTLISDN